MIPGFELGELIGRGGCASVYRARQLSVDRDVALKIDNRHVADERDRRRFLREVTAVGRLSGHPHVIEIYDAGVLADDRPYLAMQLCPNGSLYEHVRDVAPLTAEELQRVGVQLSDALATAHAAGIVHRDVKPGNMLVNGYGVVVLSDFGLASIMDADSRQSATRGVFTPAYAAPEALAQEEPTPAMDLWSFACTVFELATGRLPHFRLRGEPIGPDEIVAAAAAVDDDDPGPVRLPPDLVTWLVRGLSFDPARRWSSAAQMRDELAALDLSLLSSVPAGRRRAVTGPAARSFPSRSVSVASLATQASPDAGPETAVRPDPVVSPEPAVRPVPPQPSAPPASAPALPASAFAPARSGSARSGPRRGSSAEWWEPRTAGRPGLGVNPAPGDARSPRRLSRSWLLAVLAVVALAVTAALTWVVSGRGTAGSSTAAKGGPAATASAPPSPSSGGPVVVGSNGQVVIGSNGPVVIGGAGGASATTADPAGLWVLDGARVRTVLDRIAAAAGHPLRFVQVLGAHGSGYSLLVVQVQDPADHETVLQYTVDAGGTVTGPQQTSSASLLDPGATRLTAAMVDRKTFGPSALLAPTLFARAQRDAVARTHIRNAEVTYWTLNALGGKPRLLLGVESSYGKAVVEIGRHGEVLQVLA